MSAQRTVRKQKMRRIVISIPENLLKQTDQAAEQDFTSRSDIIRTALLWYLRPQGGKVDPAITDEIFRMLKNRRAKASLDKMMREKGMLRKRKPRE